LNRCWVSFISCNTTLISDLFTAKDGTETSRAPHADLFKGREYWNVGGARELTIVRSWSDVIVVVLGVPLPWKSHGLVHFWSKSRVPLLRTSS